MKSLYRITSYTRSKPHTKMYITFKFYKENLFITKSVEPTPFKEITGDQFIQLQLKLQAEYTHIKWEQRVIDTKTIHAKNRIEREIKSTYTKHLNQQQLEKELAHAKLLNNIYWNTNKGEYDFK